MLITEIYYIEVLLCINSIVFVVVFYKMRHVTKQDLFYRQYCMIRNWKEIHYFSQQHTIVCNLSSNLVTKLKASKVKLSRNLLIIIIAWMRERRKRNRKLVNLINCAFIKKKTISVLSDISVLGFVWFWQQY